MGTTAAIGSLIMGAYSIDRAERQEDKLYAERQKQKKEAEQMMMDQRSEEEANAAREEAAKNRTKKRTASAEGRGSTIKTGSQGLGEIGSQNTEVKTLLGY